MRKIRKTDYRRKKNTTEEEPNLWEQKKISILTRKKIELLLFPPKRSKFSRKKNNPGITTASLPRVSLIFALR